MGLFDMAGEVIDTLTGPVSSIARNVFMDQVSPKIGCVVRTDLWLGLATHTGIYVGDNTIIEITEEDDTARVRAVTPKEFVSGGPNRTGVYIYIACGKSDGEVYALGSEDIARRAREAIGSRGEYYFMCNNCHQFTRYCVTGVDDESSTPWTVDDIVEALKKKFVEDEICWRSAAGSLQYYK